MMKYELIFPEAQRVLEQAVTRHATVWPFVQEAIDLAHMCYNRGQEISAAYVPGTPAKSRSRHDVSDDCWRYLKSIADPLVGDQISEFSPSGTSQLMCLPDGLRVRVKKCDRAGRTSNYPTKNVTTMGANADMHCLFGGMSELDQYIADGLWMDVVFEAGEALGTYEMVGLRFSNAKASPLFVFDPPTSEMLYRLSPASAELAQDARTKLTA